ncbi:hypothetical protein V6Z11_D06G073100 [Gossypium hirsutum]
MIENSEGPYAQISHSSQNARTLFAGRVNAQVWLQQNDTVPMSLFKPLFFSESVISAKKKTKSFCLFARVSYPVSAAVVIKGPPWLPSMSRSPIVTEEGTPRQHQIWRPAWSNGRRCTRA